MWSFMCFHMNYVFILLDTVVSTMIYFYFEMHTSALPQLALLCSNCGRLQEGALSLGARGGCGTGPLLFWIQTSLLCCRLQVRACWRFRCPVKECSDHWLTADTDTEDTELVSREKRRTWSQSTAKGTWQECASLKSNFISPSWLLCGGWGPAVWASWVIYLFLKSKKTVNSYLEMIHNLLMPAFGFDLYLKNGSFSSVFIAICNGKDSFTSLSSQ